MNLLGLVVIVSWIWMMATALHLDDARTEGPRNAWVHRARRDHG